METMEERSARERAAWEEWIRQMGMDKIWERLTAINPFPGKIPLSVEIFTSMPVWRHIFRHLGMNPERWQRLKYENFVEWAYRIEQAVETCSRLLKHPPPPHELYHMDNLCYLSHPPAYLCKADVGKTTCQMLYGKYATVEYVHVDDFTREVYWILGYHNEDGIPVHNWLLGASEEISQYFDEEDEKRFFGRMEIWTGAPNRQELDDRLNRRHLRTGVKVRDVPKYYWDPYDWGAGVRDVILDLRTELFSKWLHATLYIAGVSAYISTIAQNALMSSEFFLYVYYGLNTSALGLRYNLFSYVPLPPILRTLLSLPQETFVKRMSELFLGGYNTIHKYACPEKKIPNLFKIRKFQWEHGQFYPHVKGILPPFVLARAIPPSLEPINLRHYLETPPSKEFLEVLESEGDLNKETGMLPSIQETGRFHFLFDPSVEPLRPSDFPPLDPNKGQIWPFDLTREKLEIMVEEGYDGSGRNVEYYSKLADKRMGKKVD